jgi:hypothetical protein
MPFTSLHANAQAIRKQFTRVSVSSNLTHITASRNKKDHHVKKRQIVHFRQLFSDLPIKVRSTRVQAIYLT